MWIQRAYSRFLTPRNQFSMQWKLKMKHQCILIGRSSNIAMIVALKCLRFKNMFIERAWESLQDGLHVCEKRARFEKEILAVEITGGVSLNVNEIGLWIVTEPKWVRLLKREHEKLYKKDFMFLMKKQRRSEGDMKWYCLKKLEVFLRPLMLYSVSWHSIGILPDNFNEECLVDSVAHIISHYFNVDSEMKTSWLNEPLTYK